jgi:hypothetical protein
MLQNLRQQVRECLQHAEDCAHRAKIEPHPNLARDFVDMERRWLGLARSWQFSEQLDTFSKHNKKPRKEAEEASKKPNPEEYGQRATEARKQANACRNQWERQGLLIVADQYERLAAYKNLTAHPSPVTAPAQAKLRETATLRPPMKPGDGSPNKQPSSDHLGRKGLRLD